MANAASSSSSSISSCDLREPPLTPANILTSSSSSSSSAIDFLSLCHRLKVISESALEESVDVYEGQSITVYLVEGKYVTLQPQLMPKYLRQPIGEITTKRAGWIMKEIKGPESIADHMYRMGLMALILDVPGVDRDKCIRMAIVHDIAEAIVGDITPLDGVSNMEKYELEQKALDHMCKLLGGESRANEIHNLWTEYEDNSTPEAKIVKDLDKVEMLLQALEYENEQGKNLDEFFQSTAGKFQTELGKAWASEVASRRKN